MDLEVPPAPRVYLPRRPGPIAGGARYLQITVRVAAQPAGHPHGEFQPIFLHILAQAYRGKRPAGRRDPRTGGELPGLGKAVLWTDVSMSA